MQFIIRIIFIWKALYATAFKAMQPHFAMRMHSLGGCLTAGIKAGEMPLSSAVQTMAPAMGRTAVSFMELTIRWYISFLISIFFWKGSKKYRFFQSFSPALKLFGLLIRIIGKGYSCSTKTTHGCGSVMQAG
jgi:hypothetical protein